MATFRKGDFLKQIGGDAGIVFDGRSWLKFECLGCAYALGLLVRRLQNGDHTRLWTTHFGKTNAGCVVTHNSELHHSWLLAGKPTKGLF